VTICQVRSAASALLDALPLSPEDQKLRLAKAAKALRDDQRQNAASRACHTKARRRELRAMGIRLEKLRCCIPP